MRRMGRVGRVTEKDLEVADLGLLPLSPMEEELYGLEHRTTIPASQTKASKLEKPLLLYLLVVRVCTHAPGIQRTTLGVGSLLPPCGTQGMNSGHQVWQQELLPTESSHQSTSSSLSTNDSSSMPLSRPFQIYLYTLYQPTFHSQK